MNAKASWRGPRALYQQTAYAGIPYRRKYRPTTGFVTSATLARAANRKGQTARKPVRNMQDQKRLRRRVGRCRHVADLPGGDRRGEYGHPHPFAFAVLLCAHEPPSIEMSFIYMSAAGSDAGSK